MDSKSCPLALLAKTCSQIGADSSDIGSVVGNGTSNIHSNSANTNSNKGSLNQHRDSIINVASLYERSNNTEGSKSRGNNASPSDIICPTSLNRSPKSPSIGFLLHHNNNDRHRSEAFHGTIRENNHSECSRSSSVEINVTRDPALSLISPTKDTSSLSSLSSLSSASTISRKSQSRGSENENNIAKHNSEYSNHSKEEESEKPMPPLIEHKSISEDSNKTENKSSDILSKPSSSSNQGSDASKLLSQPEKSTVNTSKSSSSVKTGLESLIGHPRDLPLGTYPRNNGPGAHNSNISESLQNYLMYQSLSNYSQNSPSASTLSPHLALALAAGTGGRNPFMPNNLSASLTGSIPGGAHPFPPSGVCRDPLCRDPLCPTSLRNQQLLAAATGNWSASSALSHYSSLFSTHSRENMLSAAQRQAIQASMLAAAATGPPGSAGGSLPYICNWVSGMNFIYSCLSLNSKHFDMNIYVFE